MPIKKDGTGKRWVEMEYIMPGTPEQLWEAMATGAGNAAWFVAKAEIEERAGGALRFDFGTMGSSSGEVTAWESPHRFDYIEREWSEGAPPVATEITINSRGDGKCVVRMVHSLFASTDDWDDQMEGFEGGWPSFFEVLRIYLTHFAGMKAASFRSMGGVEGDELASWQRFMAALGLSGVDAGERRATTDKPQRLSGVIERIVQDGKMRVVTMRLDAPAPGIAMFGAFSMGGRAMLSINTFFYGDDAADVAAASEDRWNAWLDEFAATTKVEGRHSTG